MSHQAYHSKLHPQDLLCPCGSGEVAGECCQRNEPCACGSGKPASKCHFRHDMAEESGELD